MAPYLEISDLTKQYSEGKGIRNVSFDCPEGSFTVLLGPSGAGKTTTISIIAGILEEDAGDVRVGGESIRDVSPQDRRISMAFEDYALYPTHSIYENIASPLRARKVSEDELSKRVHSIASLLGIEQHLEKLPSQVSGGQKQRTGLSRCLVRDADIYLLDEPIAHLDAKLRHRMRGEFKRIHKELGKTMVYVSHDFKEALALAEHLIILDNGEVVQQGSPQEVFNKPRNTFVATLLGDPPMNLVDYESCEAKDGTLRLSRGENTTEITGTAFADRSLGPVKLGFRDFTVTVHSSAKPNSIEGQVYVAEPVEDYKVYTLTAGNGRVKVLTPRDVEFGIDTSVYIALDPERISLFDAETGERIEETA
jgi:multiple sugar transport system ATP-binding protein